MASQKRKLNYISRIEKRRALDELLDVPRLPFKNESEICFDAALGMLRGIHVEATKLMLTYNSKVTNSASQIHCHDLKGVVLQHLENPDVDINQRYGRSETLLHIAAREDDYEVIQLLVSRGADVTLKNKFGLTPLHLAAIHGQTRNVDVLLQYCTPDMCNSVRTKRRHKMPPSMYESFRLSQIKYGFTSTESQVDNIINWSIRYPLRVCTFVANEKLERLKTRMSYQNNSTVPEEMLADISPLLCAIRNGNDEMIEMMLRHGADVNSQQSPFYVPGVGMTPLHAAVFQGSLNTADVILRHMPDARINQAAFDEALSAGNIEMLNKFYEHGLFLSIYKLTDYSTVEKIVRLNLIFVVEQLLKRGSNVVTWLSKNSELMHEIVVKRNVEMLRLTLKYGLDVNGDPKRRPVLISIVESCDDDWELKDIVEILLSHGADTDQRCAVNGSTVLHSAVKSGKIDVLKMILENGANVNATDYYGKTPLHTDAWYDRQCNSVLLLHGGDINFASKRGNNLLNYFPYSLPISIVRHIAKMRVLNQFFTGWTSANGECLQEYQNRLSECLAEIERLKEIHLRSDFSAFDLLTMTVIQLSDLSEADIRTAEMIGKEYYFPIFGEEILERVEVVRRRQLWMNFAADRFQSLIDFRIPDLVLLNIVKFLYPKDLYLITKTDDTDVN